MKITILGTGYVGLTTGTCLAELGNSVICVDTDEKKIQNLKKGIIPIYEPGLEKLVNKNFKEKRIKFTTNSKEAINFGEIVISAVGTPPGANGKSDLKYVKTVAKTFGTIITGHKIFINKSTVPVGTGDECKKIINREIEKRKKNKEFEKNDTPSFDVVSNPEFLKEGAAIKDTMNPDRIVIGCESEKAKTIMTRLYENFSPSGKKLFFTDIKTAEIIKYASNAMLATRISFINELANFCEKAGGNVHEVAKGMGMDRRIGPHFLNAGIGYGGSCFPKDVQALIETGKEFGYDFKIIKATERVNEEQKTILFKKLKFQIKNLKNKKIAIWGLAFKPETDDMREAPSIKIIDLLQKEGARIFAFDPQATKTAKRILPQKNIVFSSTPLKPLINADALLILTEWDVFKKIKPDKIKNLMKGNLVIDGRNIINEKEAKKALLKYICIGKKN